ncbi:uncharacterized protein LOC132914799 [Bombus pascuorum]|uniref:uncharacterized protein LOC132914799 n=1 Tax=Bombus pascuorum TaxID=65598 RepID=UPI00298EABB1|nr:uncharacterized protein LOC132914799 [Bombus pascuorum]
MRYLGLIIDDQWSFEPHFALLASKVTAAANALCDLLPNIGGAGTGVRRLYDEVIRARILYGAPVWAKDQVASRRSQALLRRIQRTTAIRIARGYKTVLYVSATILAASLPYELQVLALQKIYEDKRSAQTEEGNIQPLDIRDMVMEETWEDGVPSWRRRPRHSTTERTTQVLTGHDVFGEFLQLIQREVTSICHRFGEAEDSAQHTLEHCPVWAACLEAPDRVQRGPRGDCGGHASRPIGVRRRLRLLRARYASEGTGGEGQNKNRSPSQSTAKQEPGTQQRQKIAITLGVGMSR